MTYHQGERVALEHTDDPHTRLRPGDEGTIRRYDPHMRIVTIDWDSGSRLAMSLDAGDRIRRTGHTATADTGWQQVLDAMRAAGATAGTDAAHWWAQDSIGGRVSGDVTPTARRVLAGINDGDPAILDTLPSADWYATVDDRDRYAHAAPDGAPPWTELTAARCDETRWAWCDGFDDAVTAEVARQCRATLSPTGDDHDPAYLHPDELRIDRAGMFGGDWAWETNTEGERRIPVGFVGVLVDTWNGWAVFRCTRKVAEAIVADQQAFRERLRQQLTAQGVTGDDLTRQVDGTMARMRFDGDTIVVDERRVSDDPDAVERIEPDTDGQYVVKGRSWTWTAVAPTDCDRIVGDIRALGDQGSS